MAKKYSALSGTLLSLLSLNILASPNSLDKYNNSAGFAVVAQNMHYEELKFANGQETVEDKNHGTIPGGDVFIRHQFGILYTEFGLTGTEGVTPYNGFIQGSLRQVESDETPSFLLDGYGAFGINFRTQKHFAFIPYAVVGFHRWGRTNLPVATSGDHEDYQNNYYGYGLRLEFLLGNAFIVSMYGNAGKTFEPQVYSPRTHKASDSATPVGATLLLQPEPWYNVGASFDVAMFDRLHAFAALEYTAFRYGASPRVYGRSGDPNSGTDEPDSKTRYWVAMVGLAYDQLQVGDWDKYAKVINSIGQLHNQATLGFWLDHQTYILDPLTSPAFTRSGVSFNEHIRTGTHEGNLTGGIIDLIKTFDHVILRTMGGYVINHARFTSSFIPPAGSTTTFATGSANIKEYRTELSLGYLNTFNNTVAVFPFLPIGYQYDLYMIRFTQFNTPESNEYKFFYTGVGLGFDWKLWRRLIVEPSVAGGWTFDNTLFFPIARLNFLTNSSGWYELGLKVDLALTKQIHISTSVGYRQIYFKQSSLTFRYGDSNLSGILPQSTVKSLLFMLGVSYQLVDF